VSEPPPRGPRPLLAALGILLWLAAAAAAVRLGFWRALGTTAVIVGVGSVMVDPSLAWSLVRQRRRRTARFVLLGLLSGAGMAALAWGIYPAVVGQVPWMAADTSVLYLSFAALPLAQAGLILPAVVLGEELFWRGLLHEAFLSRLPAAAAAGLGPWATPPPAPRCWSWPRSAAVWSGPACGWRPGVWWRRSSRI
jgi:membrane protease YdiL (CAAX protease family)